MNSTDRLDDFIDSLSRDLSEDPPLPSFRFTVVFYALIVFAFSWGVIVYIQPLRPGWMEDFRSMQFFIETLLITICVWGFCIYWYWAVPTWSVVSTHQMDKGRAYSIDFIYVFTPLWLLRHIGTGAWLLRCKKSLLFGSFSYQSRPGHIVFIVAQKKFCRAF